MVTYVVRVWLPDRPGALGQVASRIGAVRGDVVGIEILERGGGSAIDELVVDLSDEVGVDLLVSEIKQVDGVAVEDVRIVAPDRQEMGMAALEIAARLIETAPSERLARLCVELVDLVDGEWSAALRVDEAAVEAEHGACPDIGWLSAFLAGSRHLDEATQASSAPGDLAWTHLDGRQLSVAVGRRSRPFHARERQQVNLLGRIAVGLLG